MTTEEQNLIDIFRDKDGAIRFLGHLIATKQRELDMASHLIIQNKVAYDDKPAKRDKARRLRARFLIQLANLQDARAIVADADPLTQQQVSQQVIDCL